MKICMLSGSWPATRCGVGDYTAQLALKLSQAGQRVTILTTSGQRLVDYPGIEVKAIMSNWKLFSLVSLYRQLETVNPDIVHIQYPGVGLGKGLAINTIFTCLRFLQPKIKCFITLHEYSMFSWFGKLRLWPTLSSAHQVICTNDYDATHCNRWLSSKKIAVIPLGSSIGEGTSTRSLDETRSDKIRLLHFGTIMPNKGWDMMLDALTLLRSTNRLCDLTVIADLQPSEYLYHQLIAKKISAAGLDQTIRFTGFLSALSISQLMQEDRLVVLPYTEGVRLNRSSFIAMLAYGKAIITTDAGLNLEHIEPQQTCWMIPLNDPRSLADAIEQLWQEPVLCRQLEAGAKRAYRHFTWSVIREKTLDLYQHSE